MTLNRKIIQLTLISVGILLILSTYYFYPKITERGILEQSKKKEVFETDDESSNLFENVKYNGFYDVDTPFTVEAKKAKILKDDADVVLLTNMKVVLEMNDGTYWTITSDTGSYNKITYDCFFIDNVKASNNKTSIYSDNLDLLASKDFASVYNNVYLVSDGSNLKADKIDYDFTKKLYKVSMFRDDKVKVKLINE